MFHFFLKQLYVDIVFLLNLFFFQVKSNPDNKKFYIIKRVVKEHFVLEIWLGLIKTGSKKQLFLLDM